jgi:hypothetical protein
MGKPRTYSCWDTSVKIQNAGHGLGFYGNTYEIFPGGGYTRTGGAIGDVSNGLARRRSREADSAPHDSVS